MKDLELLDDLDTNLDIDMDIDVYKKLVLLGKYNLKPEVELQRKYIMYSKIIRALKYNSKQIEYELINSYNDNYAGIDGLEEVLCSLKTINKEDTK